ncbi:protein jag, partial [Chloroflexota bacterium]
MLLELLGTPASVTLSTGFPVEGLEGAEDCITLDISGDDLGILIGRQGQTLVSLQYLVRLIVYQRMQTRLPIIVDVEGYKRRRCETLRALAWRVAEQVSVRRMPFALEPMSAFDRRIIHLALADHTDVTTESTGIGEMRKVVVLPKDG